MHVRARSARAQPGDERVEPVLQHEELEVAAGAVQRGARRERARAGRPRRLVEDRCAPASATAWRSGIATAVEVAPRRVLEPAVDRLLRVTIRPAASARRSSLASSQLSARPRRRESTIPAQPAAVRIASPLK